MTVPWPLDFSRVQYSLLNSKKLAFFRFLVRHCMELLRCSATAHRLRLFASGQ